MDKISLPGKALFAIPLLISTLALTACGGGSSSDSEDTSGNTSTTKTGTFIDAPVQGLGYQTPSHQGTTNENGEFQYEEGERVSFFFDGIDLGEVRAQEIVPITLLTYSPNLARVAQTMDTNPDPNIIDLSGISLGNNLRAELQRALDGEQERSLEEMLNDQVLADLQTANGVTFVSQTLVSHTVAANHVKNSVAAVPLNNADISRKIFIENEGNDFAVNFFTETGAGSTLVADEDGAYAFDYTWLLNTDNNLQLSIADTQVVATKLSKNGRETDFIIENQTQDESILVEWTEVLPLNLADLDGMHLKDDTSDEEYCSGRTISFSANTVIAKERCDGQLQTFEFIVEAHPYFDNALLLTTSIESEPFAVAVFLGDGDIADGTYVMAHFENQLFTDLSRSRMVQVNSPLQ